MRIDWEAVFEYLRRAFGVWPSFRVMTMRRRRRRWKRRQGR